MGFAPSFLRGIAQNPHCPYGNRAYEDTLRELEEYVTDKGFCCIAAIAAVAEHSIMHQFATGRPDEADQKELVQFSGKILDKVKNASACNELKLPGNYPYREYKGVPLKPKVCPSKARKLNSILNSVYTSDMV